MARVRRSIVCPPSRLLALAAIAVALAAPHQARAANDFYWRGGNYDNWFDDNWKGFTGGYPFTTPANVYFGDTIDVDWNGYVNFSSGQLRLTSLNFADQQWFISDHNSHGSFEFERNSSINVATSSGGVIINNGIEFTSNLTNQLTLNVGDSATLTLANSIYGNAALVKTGAGTAVLNTIHEVFLPITVSAGRLVDYIPRGDYVDNATLEFRTLNVQDCTGVISGSGSLVKSGGGFSPWRE